MAIFVDSAVADAVAEIIINEPGVMYLCHVVPNFEAEWNNHTDISTLSHYLSRNFSEQVEAFKEAYPGEALTRNVRAYLVLNMKPLFHLRKGAFSRDLDENILGFFRERGV